MNLYYHSDIITKIFGAFKCKLADADNAYKLVESLTAHRLENFKETPDDPATQVTKTLYAALSTKTTDDGEEHFITEHILCAPYTPETLQEEGIKKMLLDMCARGRFIPFMISLTKDDIDSENNIAVAVAGVGEYPELNFMVMTINITGVAKALNLKFDENNRDMAQIIYPLSFDVPNNLITAILTPENVHVRTFIMKTEEAVPEAEEVPENEATV